MSTCEIFDLQFADFTDKFEDQNCLFTQKYVISTQQIRVYRLKESFNIDVEKALETLNDLKEKLAYHKHWSPFFFKTFEAGKGICG